ncbi:hypothetical protein K461DRAFT_100934 [Myriangium duriaei CBS 260.36]|uniref:Secreted protein n=1 Tax=Myriangium duriaei CBS 260.36 TaxID=1168546 RepID=A0A9P4MM04_9PEZI|nr:hypothetical protein K461DRAFT_100934 [Myriangium duriaei CBS 260.36]
MNHWSRVVEVIIVVLSCIGCKHSKIPEDERGSGPAGQRRLSRRPAIGPPTTAPTSALTRIFTDTPRGFRAAGGRSHALALTKIHPSPKSTVHSLCICLHTTFLCVLYSLPFLPFNFMPR